MPCGDTTNADAVARLLGDGKPQLMVSDPPYGIELDSECRGHAGLNGCGNAEPSYMKMRTQGRTETTISGDTRADWSEALALVPSLEAAYVWHDLPATDPYFRFVQQMRDLGFWTGCGATLYCESSMVTRDQMAPMIMRSLLGAP